MKEEGNVAIDILLFFFYLDYNYSDTFCYGPQPVVNHFLF